MWTGQSHGFSSWACSFCLWFSFHSTWDLTAASISSETMDSWENIGRFPKGWKVRTFIGKVLALTCLGLKWVILDTKLRRSDLCPPFTLSSQTTGAFGNRVFISFHFSDFGASLGSEHEDITWRMCHHSDEHGNSLRIFQIFVRKRRKHRSIRCESKPGILIQICVRGIFSTSN